MEIPLSIANLQEQWLLSFWGKLEPANITELFWQLRSYVVLHHVEFKKSAFSFSEFGTIRFTDIICFIQEKGTLGILTKDGRFCLFSGISVDRKCILVCNPDFYERKGKVLPLWSGLVGRLQLSKWKMKEYLRSNIL